MPVPDGAEVRGAGGGGCVGGVAEGPGGVVGYAAGGGGEIWRRKR